MSKKDHSTHGFSTRSIHAGQEPDPRTGAVSVPIYQTSTFAFDSFGQHKGYDYSRAGNPTREALEDCCASLEGGVAGTAFASGMAAITTLMTMASTGERVVFSRNVYGGTWRLLDKVLKRYGIDDVWVDSTDLGAVEKVVNDQTKLVFLESPTNPMMEITDIRKVSEIAHAKGAKVAVDNTFLSPYFQQPLALGADIAMHSTTKYLNGHSDGIGGMLVAKHEDDAEWFEFVQKSAGGVPGPFDCFLTLRGIKTLAVRMERHQENAMALAKHLADHPKVSRVLYPGLPDTPGHELQKSQGGFGGMITFFVDGLDEARRVLENVEIMLLAESLGGVESLISHPASMTHASVEPERRAELGITDGLVRISVGIEDTADLINDLDRALDA